MKKVRLLLPLFAVTLGACSTYSPIVDGDQGTTPGQKVSGSAKAEKPLTALTVEPTTRITNGVSPERAAYLTGKSLLSEHKTDAAINSFAKALSLNPKMVDAYVGIGVAQSMANRQTMAIAAFDEAVRLEPSNPQWLANLGMAFARNGEFQKASESLSKAWAMAPSNKRIEAQYARVAETARLQRRVAEQAAARQASIKASGMTIITGDDMGSGMRRVSKRVYELDLEPKIAVQTPAAAVSKPMITSIPTPVASALPPLVSAEQAKVNSDVADSDGIKPVETATITMPVATDEADEKLPAPMLPPAALIVTATEPAASEATVVMTEAPKVASPAMPAAAETAANEIPSKTATTTLPVRIKSIAASVDQVDVSSMPSKDERVDGSVETSMQAAMVGAAAIETSDSLSNQTVTEETQKPFSLSMDQVAKAEAEIMRKQMPSTGMHTPTPTPDKVAAEQSAPVEMAAQQEGSTAQPTLTREQALALARQRLFERKLARARIRAARTARIGLEDQAQTGIKAMSPLQESR